MLLPRFSSWEAYGKQLNRSGLMGAGTDATGTKAEVEQRIPDEEKARLEGLVVQNGPPPNAKQEPDSAHTTVTPDSDLPKVSRDRGVI